MKELKYDSRYVIEGRGHVYGISLSENDLPLTRDELSNLRKEATTFLVDGEVMVLKGVEMFAVENIGDRVGFLLEPIVNVHG